MSSKWQDLRSRSITSSTYFTVQCSSIKLGPACHKMASKARRLFCGGTGAAEIFLSRHRCKYCMVCRVARYGWRARRDRPPKAVLRPASQAAASTRWSWWPNAFPNESNSQVHTNTFSSLIPARPQCCPDDRDSHPSCSPPASKLVVDRTAAVLHCIILAERTTQGRLHIASVPNFCSPPAIPCRYRPATYRSKRSYAIIGSMSP